MNSAQCASELPSRVFPSELTVHAKPFKGIVVLVEDDEFLRELACEVLECAGHQVLKARDAEAAAHLFESLGKSVDLLLTDVVLPGISGRDLARHMRELNPGLKVMFISGYAENIKTQPRIGESRACYLQKPFSADSLLESVDQLLRAR
jgi:two-component system cell cycle sensor histidine kinase/response regulator CckA